MTNYNEKKLIKQIIDKRKQYGYRSLEAWEKLILEENKKEQRRRDKQYKHEILTDPSSFEYRNIRE